MDKQNFCFGCQQLHYKEVVVYSHFSTKAYLVGNRLSVAIPQSTHIICFHGQTRKWLPKTCHFPKAMIIAAPCTFTFISPCFSLVNLSFYARSRTFLMVYSLANTCHSLVLESMNHLSEYNCPQNWQYKWNIWFHPLELLKNKNMKRIN